MENETTKRPVSPLAWLARLLCLALGLYLAVVCWRIEQLNAEAGYYLPRRDLNDGKWRQSPVVDEESWIQHVRPRRNGEVDRSPLSPDEFKIMEADTKEWKAWNKLRDVVRQQGLVQYPIAVLAALWSLFLLTKPQDWRLRAVSASGFTLASLSLGFAFYRGYFTSLGS